MEQGVKDNDFILLKYRFSNFYDLNPKVHIWLKTNKFYLLLKLHIVIRKYMCMVGSLKLIWTHQLIQITNYYVAFGRMVLVSDPWLEGGKSGLLCVPIFLKLLPKNERCQVLCFESTSATITVKWHNRYKLIIPTFKQTMNMTLKWHLECSK